ncbi:MFS general substrate transporter [Mytilinidion resinicola]|uniref:MFS general substrate transporter n=1 Tax=Mytilinidion resinicola TaxID=574789 RepID=A0A6A6YQK8_9PEZI|nr:MFS general substrate transporter [Mytilinidion resinicola]KAF2810799.1 MFS general substrate transporter [Mytilinidion resinicola]
MAASDASSDYSHRESHLPHPEKQIPAVAPLSPEGDPLEHAATSVSHHDMPAATYVVTGDSDIIYNKFSPARKTTIVLAMSFCAFLAPISSTTVLSAVPEVAATYNCDGAIINLSNAIYVLFMGLSPMFWGPVCTVYGRRYPSLISGGLFFAFSVGTALAPNLASFFIFRLLTGFQGTSYLIIGTSAIGDIYKPTERGTAIGWFLTGTLVGPAIGPVLGGIIVTYRSWRVIFWLQTALAGVGFCLILIFYPETIHYKRSVELQGLSKGQKAHKMWQWLNPFRIIQLFWYPNLLGTALASSSLTWNMYSLLTPIRYVINPRFALTSPITSGLFYLAPGGGYLLGTFVGGRWADHITKKWVRVRGRRVPEDRLRSCIVFLGGVIPACMLIYGWSLEKRAGGIPLPVIMMFVQGVAQLFCFPSLNTYCLDVMPGRSAEVVAGNYMIRYLFAALGTALCLPAIRGIGIGWNCTIAALFLIAAAAVVAAITKYGSGWRERIDQRKVDRQEADKEAQVGRGGVMEEEEEEHEKPVEEVEKEREGGEGKGKEVAVGGAEKGT